MAEAKYTCDIEDEGVEFSLDQFTEANEDSPIDADDFESIQNLDVGESVTIYGYIVSPFKVTRRS